MSHGFWGLKDGDGGGLKDGNGGGLKDGDQSGPGSHLLDSLTKENGERGSVVLEALEAPAGNAGNHRMGETLVAENKTEENQGQEEVAAIGARRASTEDVAMACEDVDGDGDGGVEGREPLTVNGNGEPLMGLLESGQALVTGQAQGGELGLGQAQVAGEAGQDPPEDRNVECPLPSNPSDFVPSPNGNMLHLLGVGGEETPLQRVAAATLASPRHAPQVPAAVC